MWITHRQVESVFILEYLLSNPYFFFFIFGIGWKLCKTNEEIQTVVGVVEATEENLSLI